MSDDTPTTSTRPRVIGAAIVLVVLIAAIGVAVARRAPEPPDGLVILYGDSLGSEASGAFTEELARTTDAEVVNRARPGIAPCDARPEMTRDLALDPTVVVLQFVGNNGSACARGPGGEALTGPALVERTHADVQAATEMFADRGVRVVLVG